MPGELRREPVANSDEHEVVDPERETGFRKQIPEEAKKQIRVFPECPDALQMFYPAVKKDKP